MLVTESAEIKGSVVMSLENTLRGFGWRVWLTKLDLGGFCAKGRFPYASCHGFLHSGHNLKWHKPASNVFNVTSRTPIKLHWKNHGLFI